MLLTGKYDLRLQIKACFIKTMIYGLTTVKIKGRRNFLKLKDKFCSGLQYNWFSFSVYLIYVSFSEIPKARNKKRMHNSKENNPSNINVPLWLEQFCLKKIQDSLRYFEKGSFIVLSHEKVSLYKFFLLPNYGTFYHSIKLKSDFVSFSDQKANFINNKKTCVGLFPMYQCK